MQVVRAEGDKVSLEISMLGKKRVVEVNASDVM